MRDLSEHSKRRKLWNKCVAPAAVKEYGEMLKATVRELVEQLERKQEEVIDISTWMSLAA